MSDKANLTYKQRRFVDAYLVSFNATQAAIEAGYSEKTAYSIGHENLRKPEIAAVLEQFFKESAMSAEEVLHHLTEIARGNMDDVLDANGNLDMRKAQERGKTALLKKVRSRAIVTEDSDIHEGEVEMYDRLKALELLAKYHDLINRIKVDDWRSEAIAAIRNDELPFSALEDELGTDLAEELFKQAGVAVTQQ